MKTTVVTTTINLPVLLLEYARNARRHGHAELEFVVIGDRKSPAGTDAVCRRVAAEFPCVYLDIEAQREYLARFPRLWEHLRFDSIQRRNIGLLWAYEHGGEVAITIDDDNFVMPQDFIGLHGRVGTRCPLPGYGSTSGWFNVCSLLEADDEVRFYHRGYPWPLRWQESGAFVAAAPSTRRVAVNAGMWLDDPDIDALARMARQPVVRGLRPGCSSFCLQPGTWSPFNSQNTALLREVLPAYFLSPYVGRYDDIWASYIVTRIAEHLGDVVAFGEPLVRQKRNPHDLWKDLDVERDGMILTPDFCAALRSLSLTGDSYQACFAEIVTALPGAWPEQPAWSPAQRECRQRLLEGLAIWRNVFTDLGTRPSALAATAAR